MTATDPPVAPVAAPQPGDAPNPADFPPEPAPAEAPQRVVAGPAVVPPRLAAAAGRVSVEDKVEYLSGRRIRITVNGSRFNLRAPTRDEYKVFRVAFNELAADGREQRTQGVTPDQADDIYAMAREMIDTFSDEAWDIPSNQEPPFLESPNLPAEFLAHWAKVPGSGL